MLWWRVREVEAPELVPDPVLQATFDRGHRVGDLARSYVPGGVLIDLPRHQLDKAIGQTQVELERGAPVIYEACFFEDGVFVAVDILERQGEGWTIIEVKSSTGAKPPHVPDAAIQTYVLRRAGVDVRRVEIMHLSRKCRYPDLSNLFGRVDVTDEVEELQSGIPAEIARQLEMLEGRLPDVPTGPHCTTPYDCPFIARCWPEPCEHHISTLYRHGDRARELEGSGIERISEIPEHVSLSAVQERQRLAVTHGEMVVEPGLSDGLADFPGPVAFLDFETVNPAIPVWDGCRPYDQTPVQFSVHMESGSGYEHHEYLADGPDDPREELAERLIAACRGATTVLAYNAPFERTCISGLAQLAPKLAPELEQLRGRVKDLLPVVRNHVYHPDFGGSFSIKAVLPALCPELGYDDLEVAGGASASVELERLLLPEEPLGDGEREKRREALLAYCERDTWAMVKLVERLRGLAGA